MEFSFLLYMKNLCCIIWDGAAKKMYGTQLEYFIKQSKQAEVGVEGEDEQQNAIMHNLKSLFKLGCETPRNHYEI